ncbi:Uncharacterized protein TCAP_06908 [Tolypocladium capitatum]|uniref:Uncharacterized protein n=1 Tax=Tolypocladium capitatum TaxID=45235 RepID=A0A2K3Q6N5_9HYPO|nr:Uncharacterized protein TCAP_06908 [Tolypocladium capitatum]
MERRGEEPAAAAAARTNGLPPANQLLVTQEGRRPLFASNNGPRDQSSGRAQESPRPKTARFGAAARGRAEAGLGLARRTKSEPQTLRTDRRDGSGSGNTSPASPGGTRIPRPSTSAFHKRRPISLSEAFRLAEEEEELEALHMQAMDGSPSPAPRPWRARGGRDEARLRQMLGEDHLDTKARRTNGAGGIPDLAPGIDVPLPSVEAGDRGLRPSPRRNAENKPPERSFAWQVDEDFTGGDLQVSDSPRIKVASNQPFANRPSLVAGGDRVSIRSPTRLAQPGSRSTKPDEAREREGERNMSKEAMAERSQPRRRNTKLDEIRAREKAAELQIAVPARNQPRPKNTKLDEIRRREAEGLSKRAYASARLEEIREQNSVSRSLSPDDARPHSNREPQRAALSGADGKTEAPARPRSAFEAGGERIPDTPITVFKGYRNADAGASARAGAAAAEGSVNDRGSTAADSGNRRKDSYDLLRRLARATSSSPAPEAGGKQQPAPPRSEGGSDRQTTRPAPPGRSPDNGGRTARSTRANARDNNPRPTVGFAGLQREHSADSAKSKRSSMQSEMDPTDRIEAEMKLFAPHDNHSERGSVRAPSPGEDDDEPAEATPKPQKHDFSSMPTPRVTGAYVETPATVRVDRSRDREEPKPAPGDEPNAPAPTIFGDERTSLAWRDRDHDTASDPGVGGEEDSDAPTAAARRRPRARSLPRRRPPLKNTARPPSVKADLLELQRIHNIDDSTMEDLEEMLTGRKAASAKPEQPPKQLPTTTTSKGGDVDVEIKHESSGEGTRRAKAREEAADEDVAELARYDRMSRSLRTGLLGIRTAKQGIERLEDQFSHAGKRPSTTQPGEKDGRATHDEHHEEQCPACIAQPNPRTVAYVHVAVPRLYHGAPRFRLTLLGLVLFLLSLWCAAESAACAKYCRPTACSTGRCVYSLDDPTTFGSALPVKLDQWTTGGRGRRLFAWAAEELRDWAADVQDAALGRSAADVALEGLSFEQKRRHRRRLRKKGLAAPPPEPPPEHKAKWEAWRRTRLARERAREVHEMGYHDAGEGGAIGRDERVR